MERACWCRCRVPGEGAVLGAAVRVACALWSWLAGAAAGCRSKGAVHGYYSKLFML